METIHRIFFQNSKDLKTLSNESIDLVVTSPPYPMIKMWDAVFARLNPAIRKALTDQRGMAAFEMMHKELDRVWDEIFRLLKFGGLACINIGDATRTIGNDFRLYPNHSRILVKMLDIGFSALPEILWRKQTNAPNKFMGSGMLPAGAYVTLEHEHILILRKGPKRVFDSSADKRVRRESAIFWEERNAWYSDVWFDLKGTTQKMKYEDVRKRSAAYPFEIPYRLINMFSVKGDTVVDPFLGTGTTMIAAVAAGRNCLGFEIEPDFRKPILSGMSAAAKLSYEKIKNRLEGHMAFVKQRLESGDGFKYTNKHYGFPVVTNQETELLFELPESITETGANIFKVCYFDKPLKENVTDRQGFTGIQLSSSLNDNKLEAKPKPKKQIQLRLLD
jgi:DNA modification methylase